MATLVSIMETMLSLWKEIWPCERSDGELPGGDGDDGEGKREAQKQKLKSFRERLTSGQMDSPEIQDLGDHGERVNGMQCKRKKERRKEGREGRGGRNKDVVSPLGDSQRSSL